MKVVLCAVLMIIIGVVLAIKMGVFSAEEPGKRLAQQSAQRQQSQGLLPGTTAAGVQPKLGEGTGLRDPEKEPKVIVFYRFEHRPAPQGLGSIDLAGNSVWKEVPKSQVEGVVEEWKALDIPIVHRRVRVTVLEFSAPEDSGFSLPSVLSDVAGALNTTTNSVTSNGFQSFATSVNPVVMGAQYLPAVVAVLKQTHNKVRVQSKLKVDVWLNNGSDQDFSDFDEQAETNTVTTQVATSTDVQTRQVGFSLNLKPVISEEFTSVQYKISNTEPTGVITQAGTTLQGIAYLNEDRPTVLLNSVRRSTERVRQSFVGLPVGWTNELVDKEDMIILQYLKEPEELHPEKAVLSRFIPKKEGS